MSRRWMAGAIVLAMGLPLAVMADEHDEAGVNRGALSIEGGVDFTHAYYFRGILQEDRGLIAQPWAQLNAGLVEGDGWAMGGYVGMWHSLHSRHTDAGGIRHDVLPNGGAQTNRAWFEADFYGGLDVEVGSFTLGAIYTLYTYPNHAAGSIDELGFSLSFDDSELHDLPFTFNPYAAIYFETRGGSGAYAELGLVPAKDIRLGTLDVSLELPVIVGLSIDDYYVDEDGNDDTLGYLSVGLSAGIPLPMPDRYGDWTLSAGVQWLHLFADALRDANRGDRNEFIAQVGFGFTY